MHSVTAANIPSEQENISNLFHLVHFLLVLSLSEPELSLLVPDAVKCVG